LGEITWRGRGKGGNASDVGDGYVEYGKGGVSCCVDYERGLGVRRSVRRLATHVESDVPSHEDRWEYVNKARAKGGRADEISDNTERGTYV
jgi:hypothetical protein